VPAAVIETFSDVQMMSVLESIACAGFVVDVDEDGGFRYLGLNAAHTASSGVTLEMVAGKRPHECYASRARPHPLQAPRARPSAAVVDVADAAVRASGRADRTSSTSRRRRWGERRSRTRRRSTMCGAGVLKDADLRYLLNGR
jgi:hypothetical protein